MTAYTRLRVRVGRLRAESSHLGVVAHELRNELARASSWASRRSRKRSRAAQRQRVGRRHPELARHHGADRSIAARGASGLRNHPPAARSSAPGDRSRRRGWCARRGRPGSIAHRHADGLRSGGRRGGRPPGPRGCARQPPTERLQVHARRRCLAPHEGERSAGREIEIADECGVLPPGKLEELFGAFQQRGTNRTGLGLDFPSAARGSRRAAGSPACAICRGQDASSRSICRRCPRVAARGNPHPSWGYADAPSAWPFRSMPHWTRWPSSSPARRQARELLRPDHLVPRRRQAGRAPSSPRRPIRLLDQRRPPRARAARHARPPEDQHPEAPMRAPIKPSTRRSASSRTG